MTGRGNRLRRPVAKAAALACVWLALWAALGAAAWRLDPFALLTALVLAVALGRLVGVLASAGTALPRVDLRAAADRPVSQDERLGRHQLQLEDAATDPPSSRPITTRISELARERVRLGRGPDLTVGRPLDQQARQLLGDRLSALLEERLPDRTRLSPRELARLVDDLEALPDPVVGNGPTRRPGKDIWRDGR